MKISICEQGSEEWEEIRRGRATASQFGKILTAKTMKLSAQSHSYAVKLAAESLGVESMPKYKTESMMIGIEREPYARSDYAESRGVHVNEVGFVMPKDSDRWGMSPDGIIGFDIFDDRIVIEGLLEIKCPDAETLIEYHLQGVMPPAYAAQVQGQLWISGALWCDFYAWHPELEPFELRVYPDQKYHEALSKALPKFIESVDAIKAKVKKRDLFGIDFSGVQCG